jgi:hypothetical protein
MRRALRARFDLKQSEQQFESKEIEDASMA